MPTLAMSVGQVGPTGVVFSEPTAFLDLFYKTRTYDYTRLDGWSSSPEGGFTLAEDRGTAGWLAGGCWSVREPCLTGGLK